MLSPWLSNAHFLFNITSEIWQPLSPPCFEEVSLVLLNVTYISCTFTEACSFPPKFAQRVLVLVEVPLATNVDQWQVCIRFVENDKALQLARRLITKNDWVNS